jgi:uncharacterized protein (TIGR02284 family)
MSTALHHLSDQSISWLQVLIETNIDSHDGFKEAAEKLQENGSPLVETFRRLSDERQMQASELQAIVASNAEEPEHSGSVAAAAHRTWMDLRSALGGGEHAVLAEAERGEDHIKAKYEEAIKDLAGCTCVPTLQRHYSNVKASHDKVRDLRDSRPNK